GHFAAPTFELAAFGTNAGGWTSQDLYPRTLADVNGDGMADIIGFGQAGVWESLATPGGQFAARTVELVAFGTDAGGTGSPSQDLYPRALADVNGDGMADIVGFGATGVPDSPAASGYPQGAGGDNLVNLAPGMAVTVEIKTGSRTVISYLLSPLLRYKHESLR